MLENNKKLFIFDANDILISTQQIYLYNLDRLKKYDPEIKKHMDQILSLIMIDGLSFVQSIMHRSQEYIVTYKEFADIVDYVVQLDHFEERDDEIKLHSVYSKFFINLHKLALETDIAVIYKNELEKTLLESRVKELDKCPLYSEEELIHILDNTSRNNNDIGLFTSDTKFIDRYKNKGFDIMIPDTLKFLNIYRQEPHVFPVKELWTHIL